MLPHAGGWSLNEAILSAGELHRRQPARAARRSCSTAGARPTSRWPRRCSGCSTPTRATRPRSPTASSGPLGGAQPPGRRQPRARRRGLREPRGGRASAPRPRGGRGRATRSARRSVSTAAQRPFLAECEALVEPQEAERRLRESMPAWQRHWTSDDYVEMSWYAPTVRVYVARPVLAPLRRARRRPSRVGGQRARRASRPRSTRRCAARPRRSPARCSTCSATPASCGGPLRSTRRGPAARTGSTRCCRRASPRPWISRGPSTSRPSEAGGG